MQIFEETPNVAEIYHRALSLTISKDFAEQFSGKVTVGSSENSEQEYQRRELLAVEQQAKQNKLIEEHGQSHFKAQVMGKFFDRVMEKVNEEFDNKEKLYNVTLQVETSAPEILEILVLRAASINRISPLVKSLPWLANEMVNLVNKPQYRRNSDVQVTEPNLAISYIGLENLKLVMPTFMLKHWLPVTTNPHPLMKRKMWNESLSIAMASKVLATKYGLDDFTAFTCGMFSNLGMVAVSRCFLNIFNDMYNKELKEAYDNRDKRLHDVMVETDTCPDLLLEQLISRASKIGADMIEMMRFDRLQITEPMFDLAYGAKFEHLCPIAQIVTKAKAYVAFRSLAKDDLIESSEAKTLLSVAKLTPDDITLLKKSDIDHIKLNFK